MQTFSPHPRGPRCTGILFSLRWKWQNPNAGSASHHPEHKVWRGEDVVTSLGRDDGKEPWSPVGMSRKSSRRALTRGFDSKDTMHRKRSVEAAHLSAREYKTTAPILSLFGERRREKQAMNDEGTAGVW